MKTTIVGCCALLEESGPAWGRVDIEIDGRLVSDIRPAGVTEPAAGAVVDGSRLFVTAGLINGHHHSHEGFYKGRRDNLPLELWMNYVRPLRPIPMSPRDIYLRTMIGAIEAVRSGTTTLCDDTNQSPAIRADHVAQIFQAYEDIGVRANVGVTLFDRPFFRAVPFVDEEFPPALLEELDAVRMYSGSELLDFARGLARTRHPSTHRVAYMATPSAPQRCSEDFLRAVRRMADEFDLPLMIHVQETRMQVVTGHLFYGSTMIEYLERIGFLKPKTALIHAVWLTPREIELLARRGVTVQHNPTSNLKLGSGLLPMRALLDAGVNVSLGTDGCGSIESTDMQGVLAFTALLHKLRGAHAGWIGAGEAFHAATMGGAIALGRARELGALTIGRVADLVGYRLDRIPFVPLNAPLNQLVYAAGRSEVDLVMVDGEIILRDGRLTRIDEAAILDEIAEAHARIEPHLAASEADVARIAPHYERIHRRCACIGIAEDTYAARFEA